MTLVILEPQLGAMEPDGHGGPKQVLSFGGELFVFSSSAYGRFLLEEDLIILLIASVLGVN